MSNTYNNDQIDQMHVFRNCQFCGTEHQDMSKVHESTGYVFCHSGPTGHSCWSQYVQYAERGLNTPYEQEQGK